MVCPRCGSNNVNVQAVAEMNKRGCFKVLLYIILICIPIVGWIALAFLLRGRKTKTVTYAVCQNCGYKDATDKFQQNQQSQQNQQFQQNRQLQQNQQPQQNYNNTQSVSTGEETRIYNSYGNQHEGSNVNTQNGVANSFCTNCGSRLTSDDMYCPNCGTPNNIN